MTSALKPKNILVLVLVLSETVLVLLVDVSCSSTSVDAVDRFPKERLSPTLLFPFELDLQLQVREIGRSLLQAITQSLKPTGAMSLPKDLYFQCGGY